MSRGADPLDRLARRSAGGYGPVRHVQSIDETETSKASAGAAEQGLSRTSALKLGALGGASLVVGLWRAPEAGAQAITRGECLDVCLDGVDLLLRRNLDACENLYLGDSWLENSPWKATKKAFRYGPGSFAWDFWSSVPFTVCMVKALADARGLRNDCIEECEKCPRRSSQAASSPTTPTCELKPPSKPSPPQLPPPPHIPPPPTRPPGTCGAGDLPPGATCCHTRSSADIPCYTGCAADGDGCCRSLSCG